MTPQNNIAPGHNPQPPENASCALRRNGKAYPRTCHVCKLGPCQWPDVATCQPEPQKETSSDPAAGAKLTHTPLCSRYYQVTTERGRVMVYASTCGPESEKAVVVKMDTLGVGFALTVDGAYGLAGSLLLALKDHGKLQISERERVEACRDRVRLTRERDEAIRNAERISGAADSIHNYQMKAERERDEQKARAEKAEGELNSVTSLANAANEVLRARLNDSEDNAAKLRVTLESLHNAVRAFRNTNELGRLVRLRSTNGFTAMMDAWDDATEVLEALAATEAQG
jgi:hypothetical protein